jgi:phosphotransferase system enzyme I (PtsI)
LCNIREGEDHAEWALHKTVEHIKGVFDAIEDDNFRERRSDVDFVGERVLRNLLGREATPVSPPPDAVVVAHDLSPADTAQLSRNAVAGLVTDAGGKTSHTATRPRPRSRLVGLRTSQLVGSGDRSSSTAPRHRLINRPPRPSASTASEARHFAAQGHFGRSCATATCRR